MALLTVGSHSIDPTHLADIAAGIVAAFKGRISDRFAIGHAQQIAVAIAEGRTAGQLVGVPVPVSTYRSHTPAVPWQYLA